MSTKRKKGPAGTKGPREEGPPRAGTVAIVGRPNVGKSTLLNAALGTPLAIVSPTPETTRDAILGVVRSGKAELALVDTPGLHKPRSELGRVMNHAAREAARGADVVVFVTAPDPRPAKRPKRRPGEDAEEVTKTPQKQGPIEHTPHPGDVALLADIGAGKPTVLVINKVDTVKDKAALLPMIEAYSKLREFAAVVPIAALKQRGVDRVIAEVAKLLPEGEPKYSEDDLTDRPTRFFAAEYVREQILFATKEEVPHAIAIAIDRFHEPAEGEGKGSVIHIDATVIVERPGQKRIVIGAGGEMMKRIGTRARARIEELVGAQVNLKLWVKVVPEWREARAELDALGYTRSTTGARS